jgi:glycosyltransferase involved in cell wall biosynthesis
MLKTHSHKFINISTVMSVYNAEKYIGQAIHSILQQTLPSREIIIIDDGSTDNTLAILRTFRGIHLISRENKGIAYSLNQALRLTHGEYLTFLDADDLWDAKKNELQLQHLIQNPHLDISLCQIQQFYEENQHKLPPQAGYAKPCMLIKKQAFLQVGEFGIPDAGHFMDWFQRAKLCKLNYAILELPLVFRRIHADNFTKTNTYANGLTILAKRLIDRHRQALVSTE